MSTERGPKVADIVKAEMIEMTDAMEVTPQQGEMHGNTVVDNNVEGIQVEKKPTLRVESPLGVHVREGEKGEK